MKKKVFKAMFLAFMLIATSALVACGNKDTGEEATNVAETFTIDKVASEELTTAEEPTTAPGVEITTKEEVTTEMTTTPVETAKKEETTTKASLPTQTPTQAPTQNPTVAPTTKPTVSLMDRFHIAKFPADSEVEVVIEGNSIVMIKGPNWRKAADYVDPNYGDGTKPNPYPMYQWTEGRYRCDTTEVTLGYYSYDNDTTNTKYSKEATNLFNEMVNDKNYQKFTNCQSTKVGTYGGVDIYFNCYFLLND